MIFTKDFDSLLVEDAFVNSVNILSVIPPVYKVVFEKDDDSLGHVQFITSCANLRNDQYQIPKSDLYETRKIAGNIIPAMITTTSLISGFQILEYIKIIKFYTKNKHVTIDFDSDIIFDLSYVRPNTHIKMIYDDIKQKYKNINEYKFIPIGWSIGSGLALLFSQKYKSQCIHCILLDPIYITPKNVPSQIIPLYNKNIKYTNSQLQKMLYELKNNYSE